RAGVSGIRLAATGVVAGVRAGVSGIRPAATRVDAGVRAADARDRSDDLPNRVAVPRDRTGLAGSLTRVQLVCRCSAPVATCGPRGLDG
ncbi:hypothetical protein ACWDTP_20405, partial [Mycobacterium sp. NPDC003449]